MELIVTFDGRQERVNAERVADGWQVKVGEASYHVDAVRIGSHLHSLRTRVETADNHSVESQFEVAVHPQGDGRYQLSPSNGHCGHGLATVTDPLTFLAQEAAGSSGASGRQEVTAYMPGRVVAVLVEEGAEVEAGQGIVVLEAMKMENEIVAEQAGTITKLHVQPGQNVDGGDPLFTLE